MPKRKTSESAPAEEAKAAKTETTEKAEEPSKLANFEKYYKGIGLVPESEWKNFSKENVSLPPMSFRFLETCRLSHSYIDGIPGIPSQAHVLRDYMKKKFESTLNSMTLDTKKVKLEPLKWYRNDLGWVLNMDASEIDKYLGLKEFDSFINTEKPMNNIQRIETWSMLPSILLPIQPYHRVLDMSASPGFLAGQLCEMLHADPNLSEEGVFVMNAVVKHADKMQYRWTQGLKCIFTNNDPKTFPELYLGNKKTAENRLRYDRIVCDVRCTNDGTMRKNTLVQDQWASKTALILHSEQKAVLKRALELAQFGGQVLYCTTSYNPVENEAVVMATLKECGGVVTLMDCRSFLKDFKVRPGMTTWKVMTDEGELVTKYSDLSEELQNQCDESVFPATPREAKAYKMERCVRVLPHDNNTAGFFCAVLVKNSELPWIKAKQRAMEVDEEPKLRQYGYKIRLKCHVALQEVEWTTETTNDCLETTSEVTTESFELPQLEIDPRCKPQNLLTKEDPFIFCSSELIEWKKIKEFYKISDDVDPTSMVLRDHKSTMFMTSPLVKSIVVYNKDGTEASLCSNLGVKYFYRYPKHPGVYMKSPCSYVMTSQAFSSLYPYIGKQIVHITKDDLLMLVHNNTVKIEQLSEKAQEDIKETDQGCVLLLYKPPDMVSEPSCNIAVIGVRDEKNVAELKEGRPSDRKTNYRLCGMEPEDYQRQIQEEKLAKAAKEKEEKEKEEESKVE